LGERRTSCTSLNRMGLDTRAVAELSKPFNPSTKIEFQLSTLEEISLAIYDVLGNRRHFWQTDRKKLGTIQQRATQSPGLPLRILDSSVERRVLCAAQSYERSGRDQIHEDDMASSQEVMFAGCEILEPDPQGLGSLIFIVTRTIRNSSGLRPATKNPCLVTVGRGSQVCFFVCRSLLAFIG
jgi:hypothetical protein